MKMTLHFLSVQYCNSTSQHNPSLWYPAVLEQRITFTIFITHVIDCHDTIGIYFPPTIGIGAFKAHVCFMGFAFAILLCNSHPRLILCCGSTLCLSGRILYRNKSSVISGCIFYRKTSSVYLAAAYIIDIFRNTSSIYPAAAYFKEINPAPKLSLHFPLLSPE